MTDDTMRQADVNEALRALIEEQDVEPMLRVAEAVNRGEVALSLSEEVATLKVLPTGPREDFAAALRDLRLRNRVSLQDIANELSVSTSGISRAMGGYRTPNWPTAKAIIESMGGKPDEYRSMWEAARHSPK